VVIHERAKVKPLAGIRIISLEQYGAGPFATLHLADLGAEVIKIEDPSVRGDVGRHVPPYSEGDTSLFFETFNRNKRSILLDINTPEGRAIFDDLVKVSDVVFSNLRGDVPAKIGITYDALKHLNPAIVCCSLSGYGMEGPRAKDPGYDYMLQALGGWMSITGDPDGAPTKTGLSLVDFSGGLVASGAILAGVIGARRDGIGMDCDLSLYDTAIGMLSYLATWHLSAGHEPLRTKNSAHPSIVPFQAFQATDGWFVVGCAKEKFWQRLAEEIQMPELATDPRFDSFSNRFDNSVELLDILERVFATRTVESWTTQLRAASIPCGAVQTVGEALTDSHTIERGLIVETHTPALGDVKSVASAMRVGTRDEPHRRAPLLDEDRADILVSILSYNAEKIEQLNASNAFGTKTS
jgi:crotonobetainyl-CoA:carnitine CoA-transferase CaiB-like acyl-CoA transferase